MSTINGSNVGIQGDGNATGDNNRVTVKKITHHHYKPGGGGGGKGGEGEFMAVVFGAGILLAMVTFYFALRADLLYVMLRTVAALNVLGALTALWCYSKEAATGTIVKMATVMLVAVIASTGLTLAHNNFPLGIGQLAEQAKSIPAFWCGLSNFGKQTAFLHAFTATFGFFAGLVFLSPAAWIPAFFGMFDVVISTRMVDAFERMTSWAAIFFGAVLLCGATYFHTDSGWKMWASFFKQPPVLLFCAR